MFGERGMCVYLTLFFISFTIAKEIYIAFIDALFYVVTQTKKNYQNIFNYNFNIEVKTVNVAKKYLERRQ